MGIIITGITTHTITGMTIGITVITIIYITIITEHLIMIIEDRLTPLYRLIHPDRTLVSEAGFSASTR